MRRASPAAPTPLRVRLPFRSEDEFAASYGAHVGRDGFFLATKAPKPVGADLLFDLILADGTSILRGEGVVVRTDDESARAVELIALRPGEVNAAELGEIIGSQRPPEALLGKLIAQGVIRGVGS